MLLLCFDHLVPVYLVSKMQILKTQTTGTLHKLYFEQPLLLPSMECCSTINWVCLEKFCLLSCYSYSKLNINQWTTIVTVFLL